MTGIARINCEDKLNPSLRKLWKISVFFFVLCNTAFSSQFSLMILSTISLYFLLVVSAICIISSGVIKLNLFVMSFAGFLAITLVGCLYSSNSNCFSHVYDCFVCVCLVFCFLNFIYDYHDVEFIFKAFMISGIVMDFYIMSIYGTGFVEAIFTQTRIGEIVGNSNNVGLKSCYSALIALFFLLNEKQSRRIKALYAFIIIVGVFFSLITASKKVVILLLLGFVYLFLFSNQRKRFLVVTRNLFIGLCVIALFIYLVYNSTYFEYLKIRIDDLISFLSEGDGNSSDQKRMRFLIEGFEVFKKHFLFGDGTLSSVNYFDTYSHSNFIEILMNHGIVGFGVFYFVYPLVIYRCYKYKRVDTEGVNMSRFCLLVFVSILVLSIALVYYMYVYYQLLLAVASSYVLNPNMMVWRER